MTVQSFIEACKLLAIAHLHATDPQAKQTLLHANLYLARRMAFLQQAAEYRRTHVQIGNGLYAQRWTAKTARMRKGGTVGT